jgi:hypothetical protein
VLAAVIMSIGSIIEIMSAFTAIIVGGVNSISSKALTVGIVILIIGVVLIYICNAVNLVFVIKVLNNDSKFASNYANT